MAANVGTLNILLTGSVSGLTAALAHGSHDIESFADSGEHAFHKLEGALAALGIGLSVGEFAEWVKSSLEGVTALEHLSAKTGIATEELSRLQYSAKLAHVDTETLSTSLGKMEKSLADVASGDGKKAAAALALLGLSGKDLANESPAVALGQISDKFKEIHNPAQRAQIAMNLFGRGGREIIPLLEQGSDALAAQAQEADKLGISISGVDAQQAVAAQRELDKLGAVITSIGQHVAIELAPFIEVAIKKLIELGNSGGSTGDIVLSAFEAVAKGVAYAADYLNLLKAAFKLVEAGIAGGAALIVGQVAAIADGFAYLAGLVGKKIDTTFIDTLADDLAQQSKKYFNEAGKAADDFSKGTATQSVTKFFNDTRTAAHAAAEEAEKHKDALNGTVEVSEETSKSQEKIGKSLDSLKTKVAEFGLTETQKTVAQLKALGANDEEIAQAQQLSDQYDKLTEAKKHADDLDKEAAKVKEQSLTPFQKAQEELDKLIELYDTGRLSAEQFAAAQAKLEADFDKNSKEKKEKEVQAPKLLQLGSNEAFKVINEIQNRAGGGGKTEEQQLAEQKLHTTYLKAIAEKKDEQQLGLATIQA